jgi:predicted site-specific integrase-resolvase
MTPLTTLTLGQAAKLAQVGKTTLTRAIRAGRLSATRRDSGGYSIDVSELERVYRLRAPAEGQDATDHAVPSVHHATGKATLEGEVANLREMLTMMRERAADLAEERDRWRGMAERLALPAPRPQEPATPAASWWRRLRTSA